LASLAVASWCFLALPATLHAAADSIPVQRQWNDLDTPSSRDVGKVITAIPIERMRQVYGEVKTPFKYGVVIRGITGPLVF